MGGRSAGRWVRRAVGPQGWAGGGSKGPGGWWVRRTGWVVGPQAGRALVIGRRGGASGGARRGKHLQPQYNQ